MSHVIGLVMLMAGCSGHRGTAQFSPDEFFDIALGRNEAQWESVARSDPPGKCGIRWICDYALLLAESGTKTDRIERLLDLARSMQDKDAASPTFGNFRWYWRTPEITDLNAVEFVAHHLIP